MVPAGLNVLSKSATRYLNHSGGCKDTQRLRCLFGTGTFVRDVWWAIVRDVRTSLEKHPVPIEAVKELLGEGTWRTAVRFQTAHDASSTLAMNLHVSRNPAGD